MVTNKCDFRWSVSVRVHITTFHDGSSIYTICAAFSGIARLVLYTPISTFMHPIHYREEHEYEERQPRIV